MRCRFWHSSSWPPRSPGRRGAAKASRRRAAKITCGNDPHDRVAAPITGPAASIGQRAAPLGAVLRQALERAEGEREAEDRDRPGRHAARRRHGVRREGRAVVRVELEGARRSSARPAARRSSRRRPRQGRRARLRLRLGDARLAHRRRHRRATGTDTSSGRCRTTASRARRSPTTSPTSSRRQRVYIIDDQEAYSQGLADSVQAILKAQGRQRHARLRQPAGVGLLVAHREDPGQHAGRLHPVAALAARPRRSASS